MSWSPASIGMGGGSASSRSQEENIEEDLKAVQRGDPEMVKVFRFVERCCGLTVNPIISIFDQGQVVWPM